MNKKHGQYQGPLSAIWKGISDLFRSRERIGRLGEDDRLDGMTCLITGASSGLGYATAEELARRGARVIMACRSGIPEKGEAIQESTGTQQVDMFYVDLADLHSIYQLADQLEQAGVQLDRIILNAAVVPRTSRKTLQGLEEMFVVNYLAKFLLLRLLLRKGLLGPNTGKDRRPRIIFISSESHRNPEKFEWEHFGKYRPYGIQKSVSLYGYYKLLLTTFATELARRLNPDGQVRTSVFALCPGPINSNIAREAPKLFQPLLKIVFRLFFRSPRQAAEPVVYLTTAPELEGRAEEYLFLMSRREKDPKAVKPENGKRLWELSEQLLEESANRRSNS